MPTILKNFCAQCSCEISMHREGVADRRGPRQRYCEPCKAQRNRDRVALCNARRRVRDGVKKRAGGVRDSVILDRHRVDKIRTASNVLCRDCNSPIGAAEARRDFCEPCSARNAAINLRKAQSARRIPTVRRPDDLVDPFDIFERDGWACYLCGTKTPKSLRGKHLPNSPELEHLTPLGRGGKHTEENLRCSCRSCNLKKGSRTLSEYLYATQATDRQHHGIGRDNEKGHG